LCTQAAELPSGHQPHVLLLVAQSYHWRPSGLLPAVAAARDLLLDRFFSLLGSCCRLRRSGHFITATYEKEQAKGVEGNSDVFLLITSAQLSADVALHPRCGIVSKDKIRQYFGPFASRAYRSLLDPPNINTASYRELRLMEGVGDATAKFIIEEKNIRRFSSHEDAVSDWASTFLPGPGPWQNLNRSGTMPCRHSVSKSIAAKAFLSGSLDNLHPGEATTRSGNAPYPGPRSPSPRSWSS